jgi:hypothetical protein
VVCDEQADIFCVSDLYQNIWHVSTLGEGKCVSETK